MPGNGTFTCICGSGFTGQVCATGKDFPNA